MQIQINTAFVASTAVPLIKTVFNVYASEQRFEVQFDIRDDQNVDILKKNLSKSIKTLILLESELKRSEYRVFYERFVEVFSKYKLYFFSPVATYGYGSYTLTLTDQQFEDKLKEAVTIEKQRQRKLSEKRALKAAKK